MADFDEKGFALLELFHPQLALDAWDDLNQYELHQIAARPNDKPTNVMTPPTTPKFRALVCEVEKVSNGPFIVSRILTSRICL